MRKKMKKLGFTLIEVLVACVAIAVMIIPLSMLMNIGISQTAMNKQEILVHAYASSILNFLASQDKDSWKNRISSDGNYKITDLVHHTAENPEYGYEIDNPNQEVPIVFEIPEGIKFLEDKCNCEIKTVNIANDKIYKLVTINVAWESMQTKKPNSLTLSELVYNEN